MKARRQELINIESYSRAELLIGIFLLSLSVFSYQFLLTRLFSTLLNYHFVFIIISMAIMGTGLGGIILFRRRLKLPICLMFLILSVSYLGTVSFIYFLPFVLPVLIYPLIAGIPFVIGGVIAAGIFRDYGQISPYIYFADLLGGAIGSIAIIGFLNKFGFINSLFLVGSMPLLGVLVFCRKNSRISRNAFYLIIVLVITAITGVSAILEKSFFAYFTTPYSIARYLEKGGNIKEKIEFTIWNSVSRTDVINGGSDREKIIVTDGGAAAPMIKFGGNLKEVEYLKKESGYIPFSFGENRSSLLIGSGGGKDVLFALLGGSKDIDAVEINSSTVEAVKKYKDFNGDIYGQDGVKLYVQDGRRFIEEAKKKYDNIYLSMVMTATIESSSFMLAENYIYTLEAFSKYFDHLKENGKLSFMLHNKYDLSRAVNTGIKALIQRGVNREDITRYFVIINGMSRGSDGGYLSRISMPLLIFKKVPFTDEELKLISQIVSDQGREFVHLPGTIEIGEYGAYAEGRYDFNALLKKIPFNAKPVTDENPFFYNYDKYIPTIISMVILMALTVFFAAVRRTGYSLKDKRILYFAILGVAYMMVEIPLIQKMTRYFGSPAIAFAVVIPVILGSSGMGSLVSNCKTFKKRKRYFPMLAAGFFIVTVVISMRVIIDFSTYGAFINKVLLVIMILFPAGFFMGMPFPYGISLLKSGKEEKIIPLVWGVNGLASVAGSSLAIAISMKLGFSTAIISGALLYIALFLFNFHVSFISPGR